MPLIDCEECGKQISDKAAACPACGAPVQKPYEAPRKVIAGHNGRVCRACGHVGKAKLHTPGHILLELVLWLMLIVPGLIYSVWRMSARREVCASCGSTDLVPATSPAGKDLARKHGVELQ